ncbi:MAG: hypothetical protein ROZ00_10715 [Denitratisoma sp.]|nr:hypothetical protein [Denitratisoma sp.]
MRKPVALLILASLCLALPPAAAAPPRPEPLQTRDILPAGTLRTQSQRLAKLHHQIRLDVNAESARSRLVAGIAEADRALDALAVLPATPRIARSLARCRMLWQEMRGELRSGGGTRINDLADALMIAAGKLAFDIENELGTPAGRLVDLSIRQNMLAQRMARLYMQAQLGDRSQGLQVDMRQARTEFSMALGELAVAPANTHAIGERIALTRMQWLFLDNALARPAERALARDVASTSERIMQMMDDVAQLYLETGAASPLASAAPSPRN